ncbi:hypothetical protein DM558_06345 [Entomomonas moraniae]|uniref:Uncharacterized protein n=1 Tax=Entomomonas moraniae TaxID=2213226 RepID=A0A3S9XDN3_9GAMM|nr:hypothetical protein DM558_06345 [Entomomonas moraniae]
MNGYILTYLVIGFILWVFCMFKSNTDIAENELKSFFLSIFVLILLLVMWPVLMVWGKAIEKNRKKGG